MNLKQNLILVTFLCTITIIAAYYIDVPFSGLFFDSNQGFTMRHNPLFQFIQRYFPSFVYLSLGIFTVFAFIKKLKKRNLFYLLTTIAVGPGIIVNSILKEFWGRPRPAHLTEFNGQDSFILPLIEISNQCETNCSFASGHSAIAFWLTAYAFISPVSYKTKIFIFTLILGVFVSMARIMQGRHFFSDVVFAAIIIIEINYLIYKLMFKNER